MMPGWELCLPFCHPYIPVSLLCGLYNILLQYNIVRCSLCSTLKPTHALGGAPDYMHTSLNEMGVNTSVYTGLSIMQCTSHNDLHIVGAPGGLGSWPVF